MHFCYDVVVIDDFVKNHYVISSSTRKGKYLTFGFFGSKNLKNIFRSGRTSLRRTTLGVGKPAIIIHVQELEGVP